MKLSLSHLPAQKQEEVRRVAGIVRKAVDAEMIILFGSFARGDWPASRSRSESKEHHLSMDSTISKKSTLREGWVEERHGEGHLLFEYSSDLDVLILVDSEKREKNHPLWRQVRDQIARDKNITTPVSLMVETVDFINQQLEDGRYFYADIEQEGVLIYDSGKFRLSRARELSSAERKEFAKNDQAFWMTKVAEHLKNVEFNLAEAMLNMAAFHLHQAAECILVCYLLVRSGYRPKTHDLELLLRDVAHLDARLQHVFPRTTEEDERLFRLLCDAYVDARYKGSFSITATDLRHLSERVQAMQKSIEEVCADIIQSL